MGKLWIVHSEEDGEEEELTEWMSQSEPVTPEPERGPARRPARARMTQAD